MIARPKQKKQPTFTLYYSINKCDSNGFTKAYYCANKREVCEFFKSDGGFKLYKCDKLKMYFLLTSEYFDKNVAIKNEKINFNINNEKTDEQCPINFKTIDEKLKEQILELFKKNEINENYSKEKEKMINEMPCLWYYLVNSMKEKYVRIFNDKQMIDYAWKQKQKDEKECYESFRNDKKYRTNSAKNDKQTENDEQTKKLRENRVFETTLNSYMTLRHHRLEQFLEMINSKEKDEGKIHNFLLPKGIKLSEEDNNWLVNNIHANNLWILDDKFINYNYSFSDKRSEIIGKKAKIGKPECLEGKESDIAVIFDSNSDNNQDKNKERNALFIELKNFSGELKSTEDGISQLNRYINSFGNKITNVESYLIVNVVEEQFEKDFVNVRYADWNKIPTKSGSYSINRTKPQYIFPAKMLYERCLARHELFFKALYGEIYGENEEKESHDSSNEQSE